MILQESSGRKDVIRTLQEGLIYLGFAKGVADGFYGPRTAEAVEKFQRKHKLYADGIAGPVTLQAFNDALILANRDGRDLIDFNTSPLDLEKQEGSIKLRWLKCPADIVGGKGFGLTVLREDCAEAYTRLYEAVHQLGGVLTSAGGRRLLSVKAGANMSPKSLHYCGLAFDMEPTTAMTNPYTNPFFAVRVGSTRKWEIWAKSSLPKESLAQGASDFGVDWRTKMPLLAWGIRNKKNSQGKKVQYAVTKKISANVFSFTQLAKKVGFYPISAKPSFFQSGELRTSEWWHFQWNEGLIPGTSSFGGELLKSYTLQQCEKFPKWEQVENSKFMIDWF